MKHIYALLLFSVYLMSCQNEDELPLGICPEEYYYYSNETKIFINPSITSLWVRFNDPDITLQHAKAIIHKYSFLQSNFFEGLSNNAEIWASILQPCDCDQLKEHLLSLNDDPDISSATPVFYPANDPSKSVYYIMLNGVNSQPKDDVDQADFLNYMESLGLDLEKQNNNNNYLFKVKDTRTGFESLEISNQVFESGKVVFSNPNMYVPIKHGF